MEVLPCGGTFANIFGLGATDVISRASNATNRRILGAITRSVSTNDLEALVSAGAGKADTYHFNGKGRVCSNIAVNDRVTLGNGGSGEDFTNIADSEVPKLI